MNKLSKVGIALVGVMVLLVLAVVVGRAKSEVSDHERIATLEAQVAALMACNPVVCEGEETEIEFPSLPPVVVTTPPAVVTTIVPPTATPEPPTTTPEPTATVTPTSATKPKCNQGRGNGSEGCDPGNSNHNQPSNDEGPVNRGGKQVP